MSFVNSPPLRGRNFPLLTERGNNVWVASNFIQFEAQRCRAKWIREWMEEMKQKDSEKKKRGRPSYRTLPFLCRVCEGNVSRKTKPITAPTTVLYRQMRRSSTSLRESKAFSVSWRNMKQMDRTSSVKCASEKWNVMKQLLKNWPP